MPKGKYRATIKGMVETEKAIDKLAKRFGQGDPVDAEQGRTLFRRLILRGKNALMEAREGQMMETKEYKSLDAKMKKYNKMSLFSKDKRVD